jgi:hypothetical protein
VRPGAASLEAPVVYSWPCRELHGTFDCLLSALSGRLAAISLHAKPNLLKVKEQTADIIECHRNYKNITPRAAAVFASGPICDL